MLKGTGRIICKVCGGKGRVGFECKSLDVIDVDSRTRKEYERKIREGQISPDRGSMPGMMPDEMMMTMSIFPRRDNSRRPSSRETILREKQMKAEENRQRSKERQIRNNNLPCCICKKSGYILCPECVFVTKPKYSSDAKEEYLNRWKK